MSAQTPSLRRLGVLIVALTFVFDQALKLWLLFGLKLAEEGPFQLASFLEIVLAWNRRRRAAGERAGSGPKEELT